MSNLRTTQRALSRAWGRLSIGPIPPPSKYSPTPARAKARAWVFEKHDGELVTRFDERRQGTPPGTRQRERWARQAHVRVTRAEDRRQKLRRGFRTYTRRYGFGAWKHVTDPATYNQKPRGQRNAEVTP